MNNVLLLIIDDVGIEQLSCYTDQNQYTSSYPYAYTPNIDRLAASGIRFNQCRSTPVCSPARASILTGRYSFEHGVGYAVKDRVESSGFQEFNTPPGPVFQTLPMAINGDSFAVGKWHLGVDASNSGTMDLHPTQTVGFNKWSGTPRNLDVGAPSGEGDAYYHYWWVDNEQRYEVSGIHATEYTVDKTLQYMQQASGNWFGYIAFNAPHTPYHNGNLPIDHHNFGSVIKNNHRNTRFRAILEHLDFHIGRIIDSVDENTYIFLVGDNGTASLALNIAQDETCYPSGHPLYVTGDETRPLSIDPYNIDHFKQSVYEGGVRVPLIVYGPNVASGVRNQLIDIIDLNPTIINLVGGTYIDEHAIRFDRLFKKVNPDRALRKYSTCQYFLPNGITPSGQHEFYNAYYILDDGAATWKLIHSISSGVNSYEFYRIDIDPLETNLLPNSGISFDKTFNKYHGLVY